MICIIWASQLSQSNSVQLNIFSKTKKVTKIVTRPTCRSIDIRVCKEARNGATRNGETRNHTNI